MSLFIAILSAILAFFMVVVVHEWGHFIVARCFNVSVERFSIGFGRALWSRRAKSGVEYVIGWLPLGGYVKFADDCQSQSISSQGIFFEDASWWRRALILIAGPLMNFVLAIVVLSVVYTIGAKTIKPIVGRVIPHSVMAKSTLKPLDQFVQVSNWKTDDWQQTMMALMMHMGDKTPVLIFVKRPPTNKMVPLSADLSQWQLDPMSTDVLSGIGIRPYFPAIPPVIGNILSNSPASHSDLAMGDRVVAMNGKPVASWQVFTRMIAAQPGKTVMVTVKPHKIVKITLGEKNGHGFLGASAKPIALPTSLEASIHHSWYVSPYYSLIATERLVKFHLVLIKLLCTGQLSLKALSGPVAIFQTAGEASLAGFVSFLEFVALISIVLGIFNLLPIPALDGGYLLFCMIEGVVRRPIPRQVQFRLISAGIIFLITLMVYATLNDVWRLMR